MNTDDGHSVILFKIGKTRRNVLLSTPETVYSAIRLVNPFIILFDKLSPGTVYIQWMFQFDNYAQLFQRSLYCEAAIRLAGLATLVSIATLFLGYPLAYVIAKTVKSSHNTLLVILVLCPMQLDMVIRLFGLMILTGGKGFISEALRWFAWISLNLSIKPVTFRGVLVGFEFGLGGQSLIAEVPNHHQTLTADVGDQLFVFGRLKPVAF